LVTKASEKTNEEYGMSGIEPITSGEIESRVLRAPGPVALDFYQESCPPCHVLEPRLESVAERYGGRLPVYRVDIDRDLAVAESFRVMSIPTVLVLRDGREMERLDGLIREKDLIAAFDRATGS
jgi:thioredoxin-like negative regulator of GroEL